MEAVSPQVLTVGQLTTYLKSKLEGDPRLQNILVSGEISGLTVARSGHMYLTLKDDKTAISAVMFRSAAGYLKFRPENGMKVILFGSVSVYAARGEYQFNIRSMQPDGLGALSLAYEQLKKKLESEGLFAAEHKKPLPKYPQKIGVVTSPSTAAFQDIIKVLTRRWPAAELTLCPASVQGNDAPPTIVRALKTIDRAGMDVIILARGGGSMEDLWCFNDEQVARAVYSCKTPIITGVGHETDTTLVDFVSDLRVPTPSAAAEQVSPDRFEEYDRILQLKNRMRSVLQTRINKDRTRIQYWKTSNVLSGIPGLLNERRLRLDHLSESLSRCIAAKLEREENTLWQYRTKLNAFQPQKVLSQQRERLNTRRTQLNRLVAGQLSQSRNAVSVCSAKLVAYNPLKVLARGYSIASTEDGSIIKSVNQVSGGDRLTLRVSDGSVTCRTEKIQKEGN